MNLWGYQYTLKVRTKIRLFFETDNDLQVLFGFSVIIY